jgi:hypothetical protein
MSRPITLAAVLLGAVVFGVSAARAQTPAPKHIQIPRVEAAPSLEDYASGTGPGVLVDGFLQRDPKDLAPVSEPTKAFLSYDRNNLYVAFICGAADVSTIRARLTRRDSGFEDDLVWVFLDPFREGQRAYMFSANPIGVQMDGITSEGSGDDMSFDAVWRASGKLTPDGYHVLMAIPFKSLRFPSGTNPASWAIALARDIPTRTESAFWPGITRRISGFSSQFGSMEGIIGVSPGRNIQFIPYGTFASARFLDEGTSLRSSRSDRRGGVDMKLVLRDKFTVDATVNPDFSQVESDEPQVTINQRFEVFFPEKRPFFLENADYFSTSIPLFFSRRLRDPQFGARLTGRAGRWAIGGLVMDDRQPGRIVERSSEAFGRRAFDAVFRARRDFSNQSRVGFMMTTRDFGSSSNQVGSMDARVRLNSRWFAEGQAIVTRDTALNATGATNGGGLALTLDRSGRKWTNTFFYQDLSPGMRAPLGFVPRTDIRQLIQFATLRWRPKNSRVTQHGPNMFVQGTWDHANTRQDWIVRFPYNVQLGQTTLFYRHARMMERFRGTNHPEWENVVNVSSSVISWVSVNGSFSQGTRPNFFPAPGLAPAIADFVDGSVGLTFRPASRLLLDETYIYDRLSQKDASIFDNHIARSKVNYQFTRALSIRGIVDYNAVLPNESRVALERRKHVTADVLLTYLLHPGTALYVGYTDGFDNLRLDPATARFTLGGSPTTSTGRQLFVKASYLFRY